MKAFEAKHIADGAYKDISVLKRLIPKIMEVAKLGGYHLQVGAGGVSVLEKKALEYRGYTVNHNVKVNPSHWRISWKDTKNENQKT